MGAFDPESGFLSSAGWRCQGGEATLPTQEEARRQGEQE